MTRFFFFFFIGTVWAMAPTFVQGPLAKKNQSRRHHREKPAKSAFRGVNNYTTSSVNTNFYRITRREKRRILNPQRENMGIVTETMCKSSELKTCLFIQSYGVSKNSIEYDQGYAVLRRPGSGFLTISPPV